MWAGHTALLAPCPAPQTNPHHPHTHTKSALGSVTSTKNSWIGNSIYVGQHETITLTFSGGFTEKFGFVYNDTVNGVVTDLSISRTSTSEILISATGSLPFTAATFASVLEPQNAYSGSDTINGNAYNNILKGFGGTDRIDGGGGIDTVLLTGFASQYQINRSGNATLASGPDGTKTLVNIERLQFDDKAIAFDINGTAGQAYRLYQAAFNRVPDKPGLGLWIDQIDRGMSLITVAGLFEGSDEFISMYGANASNSQLVTLLYNNVLHRAPEPADLPFWVGILDTHQQSRQQILANFSESPENQAQVLGTIQNGIEYVYWAG